MLYSNERMDYITSYLSAYENKILMANKQGLFDAAKLFELFAENVCKLWFVQQFSNLNIGTSTFPIVDLISEDQTLYVQVSTAQDAKKKVKDTLVNLKESDDKRISNVRKIVFFFLHNQSIDRIPDYVGDNMIGQVPFVRKEHLITTQDILEKAQNDLDFQIQLYDLIKKDEYNSSGLCDAFHKALSNSKDAINSGIDCHIAGEYQIDRSSLISQIKTDGHRFISIQGSAGSGKSALCKLLLQEESMVLYARAERFSEERNLDEIWALDIQKALTYLNGRKVIFFIDALEFIADCRKTTFELLQQLYFVAQKFENTYIVTSCRSSDKNAFIELETKLGIHVYPVHDLSDEELLPIAKKYPVINKMQSMKAYAPLLRIPFYLNLILRNSIDPDDIQDAAAFREFIWNHVICLTEKVKNYDSNVKVSDVISTVNTIVFERAKQNLLGIHASKLDSLILKILVSEGVVVCHNKMVRLRHDIFEDICFEQYFDEKFQCYRGNYKSFYNDVQQLGTCAYRRYQIWISNKLLGAEDRAKFLYRIVFTDTVPAAWKEQTQIGIVKSEYSSDFFREQGDDLVAGGQIWEFVRVANLYAFDVEILLSSAPEPLLRFYPAGKGRSELIRLINKHQLHKQGVGNAHQIQKLCRDCVKQQGIEFDDKTKASAILTHYIDAEIDTYFSTFHYRIIDIISPNLSAIYQTPHTCKDWIESFWLMLSDYYKSNDRRKERLAKEVIRWTIKNANYHLVKEFHRDLCALAELHWTYPKAEIDPYENRTDKIFLYGLNQQAKSYAYDYHHVESSNFLWYLFSTDLFDAIDWAISFVNRAISKFAESRPEQVATVQIYFTDDKRTKTYWGNPNMWLAISEEHSLPIIISDIIYVLNDTAVNYVKTLQKHGVPIDGFTNRIKQLIFSKSNNIAMLAVIERIAMQFKEELPGYGRDLASSLHLLYWDRQRYAHPLKNPTVALLERQMMLAVGLTELPRRYKTAPEYLCTLQDYVFALQFDADESIKASCHQMLDYMYEKATVENWDASDNLQIQKMDGRNPSKIVIDDHTTAYMPRIQGSAAQYVREKKKEDRESRDPLLEKVFNCTDALLKGEINASEDYKLIDAVIDRMQNLHLDSTTEQMLMCFVVVALKDTSLDSKRRSALCLVWVNGIRKFFSYDSFAFDNRFCPILFQQMHLNITDEARNSIKLLILNLLFSKGESGIISEITEYAKTFLAENGSLANAMMNTIIKLAEDEMLHQMYNADYLRNHSARSSDEFIPNRTRRLDYIDEHIQEDGIKKVYQSQNERIIEEYLFNESPLTVDTFDMQNNDFHTLCHIISCGVNICNPVFNSFVRNLIADIVDAHHFDSQKHSASRRLGSIDTMELTEFYQRQMVAASADVEHAIDTLFDGVDFSKFTHETIELYHDILGSFRGDFIDSWVDKERRQLCIRKIKYLEQKINRISDSYVKKELIKPLFFYKRMIIPINPNEYKASYTYADICFLNQQFSKYGVYHLRDMLRTIYQLHIDELLPHILVSISNCFSHAETDTKTFASTISKEEAIVMLIIYKAFLKHRDEIKNDWELTEAYEKVLGSLIGLGYENAAVLLDEFRLH